MKQNLTTLGSTHHFQGTAQVSGSCLRPSGVWGLIVPLLNIKGLHGNFLRDKEFFTCPAPPPRLGFVFVRCPATGSIPFPFLLSHEEQVINLSALPPWGSSEFRADIASRIALKGQSLCFLSSTSFFTQLRFHFLAIPTGTVWLLPRVFLILAGLRSRLLNKEKYWEQYYLKSHWLGHTNIKKNKQIGFWIPKRNFYALAMSVTQHLKNHNILDND